MAPNFKIIVAGDQQVRTFIDKYPVELKLALSKGAIAIALELVNSIKLKLSGDVLNVRSGRLRSSVQAIVKEGELSQEVKVGGSAAGGTNVSYAAIHEFGGMIFPQSATYLTVPLAGMHTRAGVVRHSAASLPDSFVKRSRAGNLIIFQKVDNMAVPMFLLKASVQMPERPFVKPSVLDIQERAAEIVQPFIDQIGN